MTIGADQTIPVEDKITTILIWSRRTPKPSVSRQDTVTKCYSEAAPTTTPSASFSSGSSFSSKYQNEEESRAGRDDKFWFNHDLINPFVID